MRWARIQRGHCWGVVGTSLIVAAFIVLITATLHVKGLPSKPWACDEYECSDPIYDLRTPYAFLTVGALFSGTIGILLLIFARPLRWRNYTGRPRGWSRTAINTLFIIGISIGVLVPWWVFMDDMTSWSIPLVVLIITLGATTVHITLWSWLRFQHGADREAWTAAVTIQIIVTVLTAAISMPLFFFAVLVAPPAQLLLLLLGGKIAAKTSPDETKQPLDHRTNIGSSLQGIATAGLVAVIATSTVWASLPRPVPDALQARVEMGDWPIRKETTESTPQLEQPSTGAPTPSETPASQPTQAAPECDASALEVTIDGWDAATGAREAVLKVTNKGGGDACQLQGLPGFRILQAGQDLEVVKSRHNISSDTQNLYENITIGPGESAEAILSWRGERSAYHDDSAQQIEVSVDASWVEAELKFQQDNIYSDSPFDLIEHSEVGISKWAPSGLAPRWR